MTGNRTRATCKLCDRTLPVAEFARKAGGINTRCKKCMNARARAISGPRYRESRRDAAAAYARSYYQANRESLLRQAFVKKQLRRAALAKANCGCVTVPSLRLLGDALDWSCVYCGGPFEHWDHAIPISRGGLHCLENLVTSCAKCNHSKCAKTQSEFLAWPA